MTDQTERQLWCDVYIDTKDGDKAKYAVEKYREFFSEPESTTNLPWHVAADWARYAAMDKRGNWAFFEDKPVVCEDNNKWLSHWPCHYFSHQPFQGDWKDSLQERPE